MAANCENRSGAAAENEKRVDDERVQEMLVASLKATLAKRGQAMDENTPMNSDYYDAIERMLNKEEQ